MLYGALDEVDKAALTLMHLKGMLPEPGDEHAADPIWRNTQAIVLEPLRLRVRRLAELLISLVLFQSTDAEPYYRHVLLLRELEAGLGHDSDMQKFHDNVSRWLAESNELLLRNVEHVESELALHRAWYRKGEPPQPARAQQLRPGGILSSFRSRLIKALPSLSTRERIVLGGTYGDAYSLPSSTIHYTEGDRPAMGKRAALAEAARISLLMLHCVVRVRALLRPDHDPIYDDITGLLDGVTAADELFDTHFVRAEIHVGDFVLVRGFLAEVVGESYNQLVRIPAIVNAAIVPS